MNIKLIYQGTGWILNDTSVKEIGEKIKNTRKSEKYLILYILKKRTRTSITKQSL